MASILNWSNACLDELNAGPFLGRLDEMAARLASEVAAGNLPFIDMGFMDGLMADLKGVMARLAGYEHMLLLGIGGSALGARALQKAFFPAQDEPGHKGPWLWIADNVDVHAMEVWFSKLPPEKTVVVVVSKSGGTIETLSQFIMSREWLKKALGDAWKDHVVLVTDPEKGYLRELAKTEKIASLSVPPQLGGRYSVISAVGLLPAAFMGLDVHALTAGASAVSRPFARSGFGPQDLAGHPAWNLAVWNRALMDKGYSQLIFYTYLPLWASFGDWFAQLWAESLGKEGKGSMPIPAIGVTDQHSTTQMYLDGPRDKACLFLTCPSLPGGPSFPDDLPPEYAFLKGKRFGDLLQAEALGTQMALTRHGVPLVEARLGEASLEEAGRLIALFGIATILTGWLLDINPLDQPAVELGKRLAKARLGAPGLEREKADLASFLKGGGRSQEF